MVTKVVAKITQESNRQTTEVTFDGSDMGDFILKSSPTLAVKVLTHYTPQVCRYDLQSLQWSQAFCLLGLCD